MVAWWQRGAIYHIYPRSFADGDGVGDRRDRVALEPPVGARGLGGVAVAVLSFADGRLRLDVTDFCEVDPVFGTLADFIGGWTSATAAGSGWWWWSGCRTTPRSAHPWFEASRSSRANPKRDWYVWRDLAPGGGLPNDWESTFRGVRPRVDLDERAGQYYLHSFMPQQPGLNWDNPKVEAAMHDVLRVLARARRRRVRLHAIAKIAKDPLLRDRAGAPRRHDEDWDTIHDRLRGIRRVVDEYPGR